MRKEGFIMNILESEVKPCPCCMEEHEVFTVLVDEKNIFKNEEISYEAMYEYCDKADEYIAREDMIDANDIAMKNAYRRKVGLLTTDEIIAIRDKYGISQSDLAKILGWGAKTVTRYEGHHVQDLAHDSILRKIDKDPEWYLELLEESESSFADAVYEKYHKIAVALYETKQDVYLRKSIRAKYVRYGKMPEYTGGKKLDLDKVVDVIRYFANSLKVNVLYKVKLMKLLWYSDALSYKSFGVSMTGLVYQALPMGAVPIGHDRIIDLKGISYDEVEFDEGTGYQFVSDGDTVYPSLSKDDLFILDQVIEKLGDMDRFSIVNKMHSEDAYIKTSPYDFIRYEYTKNLTI